MSVRLSNLGLGVEASESELPGRVAAALKIPQSEILRWRILRKSLDARQRENLKFVYSVAVDLADEAGVLARTGVGGQVEAFQSREFQDPPTGDEPLEERPVIVGSGPAGLLAAYYLAIRGYRPLVIERGAPVKERVPGIRAFDRGGAFDVENNYLYGEGGAGTFSDGKLTCRMSGPDVDWVLDQFVACGGRDSIRFEYRPHLGSNRLPMLVRNFRRKIDALGGEYKFHCQVEEIDIRDGCVRGVQTSSGYIKSSTVILGMGHSARDTYEMLHRIGVPLVQKPFQMGLRIEHPQEQINRHKYGKKSYEAILGAADYSLIANGAAGDLFTFCMCAGGYIIPSVSEPEMFCSNGMSNSRHDTPFANSGLVVTYDPSAEGLTHPLAGVYVQKQYEAKAFELGNRNYLAPIQWARDFVKGKSGVGTEGYPCSMLRGTRGANLDEVLPPIVVKTIREGLPIMDKKWNGEYLPNATLVGPEMRGSSPVRIERDPRTRETPGIEGLYPIGEGAGYAGGIVSAAVDGLRTAKVLVEKYAVPGGG